MGVQRYRLPSGTVRYRARVKSHGREVAARGHATASMTMDLYGHLVDANLWEATRAIGGILGASEPSERQDEDADDAEADGNAW